MPTTTLGLLNLPPPSHHLRSVDYFLRRTTSAQMCTAKDAPAEITMGFYDCDNISGKSVEPYYWRISVLSPT